jgi:hypothetical protein
MAFASAPPLVKEATKLVVEPDSMAKILDQPCFDLDWSGSMTPHGQLGVVDSGQDIADYPHERRRWVEQPEVRGTRGVHHRLIHEIGAPVDSGTRIHRKLRVKLAQPEAQLCRIEPWRYINMACAFEPGNS